VTPARMEPTLIVLEVIVRGNSDRDPWEWAAAAARTLAVELSDGRFGPGVDVMVQATEARLEVKR